MGVQKIMRPSDFAKALGVALATLAITLAATFPMVAFYAFFIEPGRPQDFYNDAAQWIAPWSSYILGPICFLLFNYWMARRSPQRNAFFFAAATVVFYAVIDLGTLPMMGLPVTAALTAAVGLSFAGKVFGAFLGAYLGRLSSSISKEELEGV